MAEDKHIFTTDDGRVLEFETEDEAVDFGVDYILDKMIASGHVAITEKDGEQHAHVTTQGITYLTQNM